MIPTPKRTFNLEYEIKHLRKLLRLPITHIEFDDRYEYGRLYLDDNCDLIVIYAKLYANDDFIGTIPYRSGTRGPMYDTLNQPELASKIYPKFRREIMSKIIEQEPLAKDFHAREDVLLDILDEKGHKVNTAYVAYLEDIWTVTLTGLNPVLEIQTATVVVTAPPPSGAQHNSKDI